MRPAFFLLLFLTLTAHRTAAGTISGVVQARGKDGAEMGSQGGAYSSRQFKFVERVDYAAMHDFLVYIEGPVGTNPPTPTKPVQVVTTRIAQKGAMFSPHILPIVAGTTVEWPNYDDILHNVFSFSEPKPFDLGLYKSPEVKEVKFDKPGRVDVFCSIHARMNCIVMVLENPFFATTNERGAYKILHVPAGTYQLKAWHERLPSQTRQLTVPAEGEVKADFQLGIVNLPRS
jgi:plastocyanin